MTGRRSKFGNSVRDVGIDSIANGYPGAMLPLQNGCGAYAVSHRRRIGLVLAMNQRSVHRRFGPSRIGDVLFALQTEILISLARLVFSCFALLAVYLDPTWPKVYLDDTVGLLFTYLLYSAAILAVSINHTFGSFSKV